MFTTVGAEDEGVGLGSDSSDGVDSDHQLAKLISPRTKISKAAFSLKSRRKRKTRVTPRVWSFLLRSMVAGREELCGGMVKAGMVAAGGGDVDRVPDYATNALGVCSIY